MNFRLHRVPTIGNTTDIKWLWGRWSSSNMATAGALKHVATEPAQLDNKRERGRRSAVGRAGRAAVLRRAPSDSDCSGETASLSADSADRVRTTLPTPRQTKARRRRGSEWEVLEGLKDGQRFERRPEVFNGYLHKKRKWPLKGWHKRFFVVDGGILVYARSPTDVARGRLHGSVDVGLSVISAKARRRRIDIDADEFIYHLRAKTPDVFRTWLNVLKAHRLYRQHLLTFGAREPVPKIHAPMEDLPTDTSSQSTFTSDVSYSDVSCKSDLLTIYKKPSLTSSIESSEVPCEGKVCYKNPVEDWNETLDDNQELIPLKFEPLTDEICVKPKQTLTHSLCSMHCIESIYKDEIKHLQQLVQLSKVTEKEQQILSTNLDKNSPKSYPGVESRLSAKSSVITIRPIVPVFSELVTSNKSKTIVENKQNVERIAFPFKKKQEKAFFLFASRKSRPPSPNAVMRKSNKATNLVKYKNVMMEPPLEKPLRNSIILRTNLVSTRAGEDFVKKTNLDALVENVKHIEHDFHKDVACSTDCDIITEKLVKTFLDSDKCSSESVRDIQLYVTHIMQDSYDINVKKSHTNFVTVLFKGLLEYWLGNNSSESTKVMEDLKHSVKESVKEYRCVDTQIEYSTKDVILSTIYCESPKKCGATQAPSNCQASPKKKPNPVTLSTSHLAFSFLKEKRIQELERLLKSTVYTFETVRSQNNINFKYKDIEITKRLIDNIGTLSSGSSSHKFRTPSSQYDMNQTCQQNGVASEYFKIQTTFNNLLGETSIAPAVAKELLGAYLQMLMDDNKGPDESLCSTEESKENSNVLPSCDVQTEPVQKKVSIGISTMENINDDETKVIKSDDESKETKNDMVETAQDPGQIYLKELLDKISTYFRTLKPSSRKSQHVQPDDTNVEGSLRTLFEVNPSNETSYTENTDDNSLVLDLTKFDLVQIAVLSDSSVNGEMSITVKLKERPPNINATNPNNVILKFCDLQPNHLYGNIKQGKTGDGSTKSYFRRNNSRISFKNPYYFEFDPNSLVDKYELKPFLSTSDATSKACKVMYDRNDPHEMAHEHESKKSFEFHDDHQSCYILSGLKRSTLTSVFCSKKKNKKECRGNGLERQDAPTTTNTKRQDTPPPTTTANATRIIDEKFILLLLENLTLLSKNIPNLHKEIFGLYLKLKKKHDKVVRKTSGLGLLGKIYYETQLTGDRETQFDSNVCPEKLPHTKPNEPQAHKAVSALIRTGVFEPLKVVNESTSVYAVIDCAAQTEPMFDAKSFNSNSLKHISISTSVTDFNRPVNSSYYDDPNLKRCRSQKITIERKEKDISCFLNSLKNFLITTSQADFFNNKEQTSVQTRFKMTFVPAQIPLEKRTNKKVIISPKQSKEAMVIKNKIEEHSTSIRISNQILENKTLEQENLPVPRSLMQAQRKAKTLKEKNMQKDFNIYFASNRYHPVRTKMPERKVKIIYKSLYRCSSTPSLYAG